MQSFHALKAIDSNTPTNSASIYPAPQAERYTGLKGFVVVQSDTSVDTALGMSITVEGRPDTACEWITLTTVDLSDTFESVGGKFVHYGQVDVMPQMRVSSAAATVGAVFDAWLIL